MTKSAYAAMIRSGGEAPSPRRVQVRTAGLGILYTRGQSSHDMFHEVLAGVH